MEIREDECFVDVETERDDVFGILVGQSYRLIHFKVLP